MAEHGTVKAVRLDSDTIERIAQHVQRLQAQLGRITHVNEGMAMRDLILRGLDMVEGQRSQPAPAIPVGQEFPSMPSAPARVPSAAPGLVHCTAGLGHPDYSATAKECPKCGVNRRARESKARKKKS